MNSAEEDREPKSNRIRGPDDVMTTGAAIDRETKNRGTEERVSR